MHGRQKYRAESIRLLLFPKVRSVTRNEHNTARHLDVLYKLLVGCRVQLGSVLGEQRSTLYPRSHVALQLERASLACRRNSILDNSASGEDFRGELHFVAVWEPGRHQISIRNGRAEHTGTARPLHRHNKRIKRAITVYSGQLRAHCGQVQPHSQVQPAFSRMKQPDRVSHEGKADSGASGCDRGLATVCVLFR